MMERLAAGLCAAAAFPLAAAALGWAASGPTDAAWRGALVLGLIALPVYLTLGVAGSAVADRLVWWITAEGGGAERLRVYFLRFFLYAFGGFAVAAGLANMTMESPEQADLAAAGALGVPAALLYYHVLLAVRSAGGRRHARKFSSPIETERLILEPCTFERYRAAEAEGYPLGNHVKAYISELRRYPRLLGWGVWFVRLKETGEIVGDTGFKGNPDWTGAVDLGYGFLERHRGKGYATEAANALVDWAFAQGAARVTAETLPTNAASIRVLSKVGFQMVREDEHYHWRLDAIERARAKR